MSYATGLVFALVCAAAAIVYGFVSIGWILKKPAGNARMPDARWPESPPAAL